MLTTTQRENCRTHLDSLPPEDLRTLAGMLLTEIEEREAASLTANRVKVRKKASDTSRAAALSTLPKSGTQRYRVYDAYCRAGEQGMTDEECQVMLGMNPSTQRPRRVELVEGGWLEDTGIRRPTRSGEKAIVWVSIRVGLSRT